MGWESSGVLKIDLLVLYSSTTPSTMSMATSNLVHPSSSLSQSQQLQLIKKLQIFKIQGSDKRGRPLLRIIGKFFPARVVSVEAVKEYLEEEIFPDLEGRGFSAVYVHTEVNRGDNFPGISALRAIYDAVPGRIRDNMDTFYFLHPGIQSRLFLATFGRRTDIYAKLKYVTRLEFLWDHVRRKGADMPDFVLDFDDDMEWRPPTVVDYGLESDHPAPALLHGPPAFDSAVPTFSMRCIA